MFRILVLLILLYVSADLGNASVPGVFSFALDQLFVDGVVRIKAAVDVTEPIYARSDPPLPCWCAAAPALATLVASAAPSYDAMTRHRPQHRFRIAAPRDRADGEPPA
jgi:hypothetical protein